MLREVTPERRLFRETWTEGLARWQMWQIAAQRGLRADIVGSPPYLRRVVAAAITSGSLIGSSLFFCQILS